MTFNISSKLGFASLALILLTCGSAMSQEISCDLRAYVIDQDRAGVNVRDVASANGKKVGTIPFSTDGTYVHIVAMESAANGWVQVDKAQTTTKRVSFNGFGFVSGNMLAMMVRNTTDGVKLYQDGSKVSKVLARIPMETEVKIAGCDGKMALVKYKNFVGWLMPEDQCSTLEGVCN